MIANRTSYLPTETEDEQKLIAFAVGDVRYGNQLLDNALFNGPPPRLFLHACRLTLNHPHTGKTLTVKAPLPQEFSRLLNR